MQPNLLPVLTAGLCLVTSCCARADGQETVEGTSSARRVEGRLALPPGNGPRGLDVELRFSLADGDARTEWAIPGPDGWFGHDVQRAPDSIVVTAGTGFELIELLAESVPTPDSHGTVDLGELSLDGLVMRHTIHLAPAPGAPLGQVRVAMWSGPPPPAVALGSRQFPPVQIGTSQEWLVPPGADDIYLLVERPRDPDPAAPWWGASQQRFGPFHAASLPKSLRLE